MTSGPLGIDLADKDIILGFNRYPRFLQHANEPEGVLKRHITNNTDQDNDVA